MPTIPPYIHSASRVFDLVQDLGEVVNMADIHNALGSFDHDDDGVRSAVEYALQLQREFNEHVGRLVMVAQSAQFSAGRAEAERQAAAA